MTKLLAKLNAFRDEEQRKFAKANYPYYGNVTTINLTILKGGLANNVVPPEMRATVDMRNSIQTDLNKVVQQVSEYLFESVIHNIFSVDKHKQLFILELSNELGGKSWINGVRKLEAISQSIT